MKKRTLKPPPEKTERRGRKPTQGQLRVYPTAGGKVLRFVISDDIVLRMTELCERVYGGLLPPQDIRKRMRNTRMLFVRFIDTGIPAVLMRIEEPTFDPRGNKLHQVKKGKRWIVEIRAKRIGVRDNLPAQVLDFFETEDLAMRGMIVNFNDADMIHVGPKADVRELFGRRADPDDLRA